METIFIITDSLEKIFVDMQTHPPKLKRISVLADEKLSFQLAFKTKMSISNAKIKVSDSAFKISMVEHISSHLTKLPDSDDFMLSKVGLYPELIRPVNSADIFLRPDLYTCLWVEADAQSLSTGENTVFFLLEDSSGKVLAQDMVVVNKIQEKLHKDGLAVINWLHCDCLADYYDVKVFGNRHFEIIHNFIKTALSHGINTIYVPCFTPALDTASNAHRTPCQLVDIYKKGDNYTFGWDKFNHFIKMCKSLGVEYYEICHLFSQWGAKGCPDIYLTEEDNSVRIFEFNTNACGKEYREFLKDFLAKLKQNLIELDVWDKTFVHISDEPNINHIETYNAHLNFVKSVLPDCRIIDALSEYEFAKNDSLTYPVVAVDHVKDFIKAKKDIFVYYCTSQHKDYVPNRFFNIPSQRNRILGMLMYRNNAKGFLHWGYNFYNSYLSLIQVNPYAVTDCNGRYQSGDAFAVYPAKNGEAYPSTRLKVFADGIQDYRALLTLERYIGRQEVIKLLDSYGIKEGYSSYPHDKNSLLELREKVNEIIKTNLINKL